MEGRGRVDVGVLGELRVVLGERVLGAGDWGGRKPQVLEVLLVHRGQPVPKERIADADLG